MCPAKISVHALGGSAYRLQSGGAMLQRKRKRKEEPADLDGIDDAKKTVDFINKAPQEARPCILIRIKRPGANQRRVICCT